MLLVNPLTGTEVETFTSDAAAHLKAHGYYEKAKPDPAEKPKPKRTRRAAKPKEQ